MSSLAIIPLTKGHQAIVDTADLAIVAGFEWKALVQRHTVYAYRSGRGEEPRTVYLHRAIMQAPKGREIDHEDGNGLNNSRANLRLATSFQNKWNTRRRSDNSSGFKGVCWDKHNNKWAARITVRGHRRHLGLFAEPEAAHAAYAEAAASAQGSFQNKA